MLSPVAVQRFLAEPRDNWTWIKQATEEEILEIIHSVATNPWIPSKASLQQRACLALGCTLNQFSFFNDMGTGKSLIVLMLLVLFHQRWPQARSFILVPNEEVALSWANQFKTWQPPGLKPVFLTQKSSEEKWRRLNDAPINCTAILPYPGLIAMVSALVPSKKPGKRKMAPQDHLMRRLLPAHTVVYDESTKLANPRSVTYSVGKFISDHALNRFALAGRPFGRDPFALWGQCQLVDHGASLGRTQGIFREAFFDKKHNYWGGPYSFDYKFRTAMEPDLARMVGHRSIRYRADECISLPEISHITYEAELPDELEEYYKLAFAKLAAARGNYRQVKNAFLRLRQISSGFLGAIDDETGDKVEIMFKANPKLDGILGLLEQIPRDSKAVIFYEFNPSGRRIEETLRGEGYKPVWIWGGAENRPALLQKFLDDPRIHPLVINHKIGAYGLDGLQGVANYVFYYESPVPPVDRDQSEHRVWRQGQTKKSFIYDVIVRDTMDRRILEYIAEGNDLFADLVDNPSKVLNNLSDRHKATP